MKGKFEPTPLKVCGKQTTYQSRTNKPGYTVRSTVDDEPSVYERYQKVFCNSRCCYRHEPDHMKMEPCINCPAEQFVEYMESLDEE
jgi:hypothetical protein